MLSLQELTAKIGKSQISELARKDADRRACIKEFTAHLNAERARDNERKVELYIWSRQVSRAEAVKVLKKHPDKRERIWPPYTERAIHFKTIHVDPVDLRDLLDRCNKAEKDGKSFGRVFSSALKVQK